MSREIKEKRSGENQEKLQFIRDMVVYYFRREEKLTPERIKEIFEIVKMALKFAG